MGAESNLIGSRRLKVKRATGTVEWKVWEFEGGGMMLVIEAASTQFHAHFEGEQWAEFQKLIAGAER